MKKQGRTSFLKKRSKKLLQIALASTIHIGLARAAEQDVPYGPNPSQMLDVCTPDPPHAPAPAVLMIHGGAWRSGSRRFLTAACIRFAKAGIVAIPIDYRLSTGQAGTTWPVQFNDVQLAMRWVRAHARTYGIDPTHICAEGDSAGGQLALLLGVVTTVDPGDGAQALAGISPHADCSVAISGPSDLVALAAVKPAMIAFVIGPGDPAHVHAREVSASPALRAGPSAVPALLIQGTEDPLVPFTQAGEMCAALSRAGTPCWVVRHPGGHEFNGLDRPHIQAAWSMIEHFVQTQHLPQPPGEISLAP
jgi:acetyl esterase/lipase